MIPFKYGGFWDVPRYIVLRYREQWLLLQNAFDDDLDEYPDCYSVYPLLEPVGNSVWNGSWDSLNLTPLACIGQIRIEDVIFDPSKRKELDASCLNALVDTL
jgi:hypothetical protein